MASNFTFILLLERRYMFNGKWTYETGEEIPEIFGSGSNYYNTYETDSFAEAVIEYRKGARNYLLRKQFKDRKIIREFYDFEKQLFIS